MRRYLSILTPFLKLRQNIAPILIWEIGPAITGLLSSRSYQVSLWYSSAVRGEGENKNETGTPYYTFPLGSNRENSGLWCVDLRSYTPHTRHKLHFEIELPQSTVTDNLRPSDILPSLKAMGFCR